MNQMANLEKNLILSNIGYRSKNNSKQHQEKQRMYTYYKSNQSLRLIEINLRGQYIIYYAS
jgi:hypothetical protein